MCILSSVDRKKVGVNKKSSSKKSLVYQPSRFSTRLSYLGGIYNRMWNKLYKRSVVEKCTYPIGRDQFEDGYCQPQFLSNASRVYRTASPLYHYVIRQGSLMNRHKALADISSVYFNELGRFDFLCKQSSVIESSKLGTIYIDSVVPIVEKEYNLVEYGVFEQLVDVTKKNYELLKQSSANILAQIVIESLNPNDLRKKYWRLECKTDYRYYIKNYSKSLILRVKRGIDGE